VGPAIADMNQAQAAAGYSRRDDRGPHSPTRRVAHSLLMNLAIGQLDGTNQRVRLLRKFPIGRGLFRRFSHDVLAQGSDDRFDGHRARDFTFGSATHSVRKHKQALLPIDAITIFIDRAYPALVSAGCHIPLRLFGVQWKAHATKTDFHPMVPISSGPQESEHVHSARLLLS